MPPDRQPPNDAAGSFFSLTPEQVLVAVEAGGLEANPVCYPLNSFENRVYEVELTDRTRVVAKFYRPGRWSSGQILEEHAFLAELAAEEIPVCPIRPFPDGSTLKRIDGIDYCLSDRRGGRAPDELSDLDLERLGMFVGRMHAVGDRRPAGSRPRLTPDHYVHDALRWIALQGSLTGPLQRQYFAAAEEIADRTDRLLEGVPVHRIHADLHLGNILFRDGELRVLDFDDMVSGPAVQDLWLALPGRGHEVDQKRDVLLAGYERFREFDRSTLRLIEPLRGLRMVRYAGWLARRWDDPAFRAGWPHFGTAEYWEGEVADLEEQLGAIREAAHGSGSVAGDSAAAAPSRQSSEELLTNKDYFWDWEED
ncbi:MAG: serine/threonine protein kinase [Thermoanaerobaculia bacterium]